MTSVERQVAAAQAELQACIADALAEWGEDPPVDDIAHDIAQSLAAGMSSPTARREFLRREGVEMPAWLAARDRDHGNQWLEQRKPLNDETSAMARHGRDPWLNAEDAIVLQWDKTEHGLLGIALDLGRSLEACRQRFYILHRDPRSRSRARSAHPRARTRTEPSGPPPGDPCPVCGLHHPGEC